MKIPVSVTRNIGRSVLLFKKQSPNIFFAAGVAGIVTSAILACKATLKLNETLDVIQSDISGVKTLNEDTSESYPIEEYHKDVLYAYGRAGLQMVKLYGPAVIIGSASIAMLTGSHVQLTRRNSALMAAYAAVQKAYDDYRDRVRELVGPQKELDIYHALTTETLELEDGNTKDVKVADPNKWSPYARFFDEGSAEWRKNAELNRLYVQCQQNYANNLLIARGHVFLNEVYDMLGLERSQAGSVVGWVIGKNGDNYVDFGLQRAFSSGLIGERNILLDFNVDGIIYDKI